MTDEFERQYLGVTDVVHSEKVTFRGAAVFVGACALALAACSVVGFATGVTPLVSIGVGVFFALCAGVVGFSSVVGTVLRTIVTETELVCHAGIRKEKRIPLAGITQVTLTEYDVAARTKAINEGRGAFVAIHPSKPSLCVSYVDASGKDHVAFLASDAPEALAGILRAGAGRAKAQALGHRVRVDEAALPDAAAATTDEVETVLATNPSEDLAPPKRHEA